MSRAALLPTPGDPFLVNYWLRTFKTWAQYVDQLYVCISWPQTAEVTAHLHRDIHAAGGIIIDGNFTEHGLAMHALLDAAKEDTILFIEDDLYVRRPEVIDTMFRVIEDDGADIVGIERGSMGQEILGAALLRYPRPGPALWPNMLFSTADRFRAITETFSARNYKPGDTVLGVGHVVRGENESADTFGAAAMEMREHARLYSIPEISVLQRGEGDYVHVGSLSSGPDPHRSGNLEGQNHDSWAIRTSWWRRFHRCWPGGLPRLHGEYGEWVNRLEGVFGRALVDKWAKSGDGYVTWDES